MVGHYSGPFFENSVSHLLHIAAGASEQAATLENQQKTLSAEMLEFCPSPQILLYTPEGVCVRPFVYVSTFNKCKHFMEPVFLFSPMAV